MKVSIITATYNRAATIKGTLDSIRDQDYSDIEHIIVDGASKDNTLEIIEQHKIPNTKILSEPDKGIFDAWNKGLKMATGDVIGFLHSDDFYPNDQVISDVVMTLKTTGKDAVFGDVSFVEPENLDKVVRYYSSEKFHPDRFAYGYMPAHPSFFTKKEFYDKCGEFKIDYKIAADYEFLIRLLYVHKISYQYIKKSMVYMRTGGISTAGIKSRYVLNKEIVRACRENGISTNLGKVLLKVFSKLKELRV